MKKYDLKFYENKFPKTSLDLKPKGFEEQIKYDIKFLKRFSDKEKVLLDLGSGTGSTINNLINDFKKIIAVEKFSHFSKFIDKKIEVTNKDIRDIEFNNIDIITAFGVFNHLDDEDTLMIYKKINTFLKDGGLFILKHAMGIKKDEFYEGQNYWAIYRHINKEISFLIESGFNIIEISNIYNDLYKNKNTNYFVIVGIK